MTDPINIHPDFQKVPALAIAPDSWLVGLLNGGMQIADAIKWRKFKDIVTHEKITGLDGYRIPVSIIKPGNLKAPCAALVFYHGGSFIMKHAPQHIENAVSLAREANCCVIFVDYRLAPKHPFPTPFNDCYAALTWAFQNAEKLGIDKQRIAVGGDSAGGALAAGVAQKAAHEGGIKLCGQLLLYPMADADCKSKSSTEFANVAPFKNLSMRASWEAYLGHKLEAGIPQYASPLHGNLTGLAPAYVEIGDFDPMRDESAAYAEALFANGVQVMKNATKGTIHAFDVFAPNSQLTRDAMDSRVQFLRQIFGS